MKNNPTLTWTNDLNRHFINQHKKKMINNINHRRNREIKTTMRYYYAHTRMAKYLQDRQRQILMRLWNTRNTQALLVGMQNGTTTLGKNVAVSYKIKHTPTSDPEIQLLSIYSRETENIFTKTLKGIVTEVLSIIAKNWKQSRYPSIEWIDCFIFTQQNIIQQKKKKGINF